MDNQNITPPQYTKLQPQKNKSQGSSFALVSLIIGIFSVVCICLPPIQLIFGGLAVMFAFLSKQEDKFERPAMIGLVIGILSCVTSILIFWQAMNALDYLKTDPEYISQLNNMIKAVEQLMGPAN